MALDRSSVLSVARHRYDDHHRDVQGSGIRAAVFGASDGLVSNVLLIVGLAGADLSAGAVRTRRDCRIIGRGNFDGGRRICICQRAE